MVPVLVPVYGPRLLVPYSLEKKSKLGVELPVLGILFKKIRLP